MREPCHGGSLVEEGGGGVRRSPEGWGGAPQASGSQSTLSKSTDNPGARGSVQPQPLGSCGRCLCGPPRLLLCARPSHSRPRGSTLLPERSVLTAKGRNKGQDKPDDRVLSSFLLTNGKRHAGQLTVITPSASGGFRNHIARWGGTVHVQEVRTCWGIGSSQGTGQEQQ